MWRFNRAPQWCVCLILILVSTAFAQIEVTSADQSARSEPSAAANSQINNPYRSAQVAFDRNDYAAALLYLEKAISVESAASGFSSAQALAGYLHLSERLINRNSETAKRYLAQAAERGDWRAAVVLSGVLLDESLVQTPQMAQRYLERARYFAGLGAKQGDVDADLLLAWFAFNGVGGESDVANARATFERAVNRGGVISYPVTSPLAANSNGVSVLSPGAFKKLDQSVDGANVAIITFSDDIPFSINNGPKTISINGVSLKYRPEKGKTMVVVLPEGSHTLKAVVGGFFGKNAPFMNCVDTEIRHFLGAGDIHHFSLEGLVDKTSGSMCSVARFDRIETRRGDAQEKLRKLINNAGSRYLFFGIDRTSQVQIPSIAVTSPNPMSAQIVNMVKKIDKLRVAYLTEDFVRLPSQGEILTKNIATQAELAAKKLTEGDGSPADSICKKLGFKPATKDYDLCRERQAKTGASGPGYDSSSADMPRTTRDSQQGSIDRAIAEASDKCRQLGFKSNTPAFGKCVLQLSK